MITINKVFAKAVRALSPALLFMLCLSSCFTGVESTPKIGKSDLKNSNADVQTPEQKFLADIQPIPYKEWKPGKELIVTDSKIGIIFAPLPDLPSINPGDRIVFVDAQEVASPVGKAVDLTFNLKGDFTPLVYRINSSKEELEERAEVEIPFTVDPLLAQEVNQRLAGKTVYITTPRWYDTRDNIATRVKYIPVKVLEAVPGNQDFPVKVLFAPDYKSLPPDAVYSVFMTIGSSKSASRNFDTMFSLTDPRKNYSHILDENWIAIIENRVRPGMTREEARLALGSPNDVDRGHDYSSVYEKWVYDGGIYLIFRDGILESFRR